MNTLPFPALGAPHIRRDWSCSNLRFALAVALIAGCGSSGVGRGGSTPPPNQPAATPVIATTAALNGAVIVTLSDKTAKAAVYYTLDGSTPTSSSTQYFAPFLVASNVTLHAIAIAPPLLNSAVASQTFSASLSSNTLVWSDEFSNNGSGNLGPDAHTWTYDTGTNCCGNNELETYCTYASNAPPCSTTTPNVYVGTDSALHIVAQSPGPGVYTSARLKTQGLFSFQYGRIEARMQLPESQGMWPAFWMLGSNIATVSWPASGEADIMEHIDGANPPFSVGGAPPGYDWIAGSVHGGASSASEVNGSERYNPAGFSAAAWHTYGMIWSKGQIQFYVDNPSNIYATFNTGNFGGTWPFDQGPMFILLNLAVGGDWPGSPNSTTAFPSNMLVDYVRIYTN